MSKSPLWVQHQASLAHYEHTAVNYDVSHQREYTPATGWHLDDYGTDLPAEAPGPPTERGSFAAAQAVLWHYSFPPPDLLIGIFNPDEPLDRRVMLQRARFLGFTFWFGVRVVNVVDEAARPTPHGPERVWGYGYRTLEGHFERGQIDFAVHKNLATGAVRVSVHAVSQMSPIHNPFYWLGFKLFGRMLQRRFARQSMARMRQLVAAALAESQTKPA